MARLYPSKVEDHHPLQRLRRLGSPFPSGSILLDLCYCIVVGMNLQWITMLHCLVSQLYRYARRHNSGDQQLDSRLASPSWQNLQSLLGSQKRMLGS